MDPEIEQLKELVRQQTKVIQDTNRLVRQMRRSQRMRTLAAFLWWLLILIVSAVSYYYYVEPYMQRIEALYGQAQASGAQAQSFEQEAQQFISQYFGSHATSTAQQ